MTRTWATILGSALAALAMADQSTARGFDGRAERAGSRESSPTLAHSFAGTQLLTRSSLDRLGGRLLSDARHGSSQRLEQRAKTTATLRPTCRAAWPPRFARAGGRVAVRSGRAPAYARPRARWSGGLSWSVS